MLLDIRRNVINIISCSIINNFALLRNTTDIKKKKKEGNIRVLSRS